MDIALILLLPLVGGHVFATNCLCSRFRVARDSGQRLYFSAVFYGSFCLICALLIRLWLISHPSAYILSFYDSDVGQAALQFLLKPGEEKSDYSIVLVALLAFGIGITWWFPINVVFYQTWLYLRTLSNKYSWTLWGDARIALKLPPWLWLTIKDDDLSAIIYMAAITPKPVSVTLDSRKVYVGYIALTPDPCQELKAISIFPLMSGYRDTNTGELKLTTRYTEVYKAILDEQEPNEGLTRNDFRTVIPFNRISSISLFDMVVYSHFVNAATAAKTKKTPKKKSAK